MGVQVSENGSTTYGPYQDGDRPEFTADHAESTVSFDIFGHKIRNAKLTHLNNGEVACYSVPDEGGYDWCVIDSEGTVADSIENLYFTFPDKPGDTGKSDVEDEVNHPKHYTGRKADLECIMFTELMPSLAANAFKYVWRCDDKGNKTEDLAKARWYLNRACTIGCYEPSLGRKIRHLMVGMIDSSDFDEWHKLVLDKIVEGYYVDAYNDISDIIKKPRYCSTDPLLF